MKILSPLLKESGLNTIISASDETNVETSIQSLKVYRDKGVLPLIGRWNTHTYSGSIEAKKELQQLTSELGIKFWQSETGSGGRGIHGNLMMAQRLMDDIRYMKPAAWVDWQYVEERNDQWSLVSTDHQWHTYYRHHNYYIRQMFSRFIPVGYTFVESGSEHTLAAVSPDNKTLVLVALNTSDQPETHLALTPKLKAVTCYRTSKEENVASVTDFEKKKGKLMFQLPPLSIATFVCAL